MPLEEVGEPPDVEKEVDIVDNRRRKENMQKNVGTVMEYIPISRTRDARISWPPPTTLAMWKSCGIHPCGAMSSSIRRKSRAMARDTFLATTKKSGGMRVRKEKAREKEKVAERKESRTEAVEKARASSTQRVKTPRQERCDRHDSFQYRNISIFNIERKASWGISTLPTFFIRFLPSACFSSNFLFLVTSPP